MAAALGTMVGAFWPVRAYRRDEQQSNRLAALGATVALVVCLTP
jgi:hypothetical protein